MRLFSFRAVRRSRRRPRRSRWGWTLFRLALPVAAVSLLYEMAGVRGLVLLGGLTVITLLMWSWLRSRRFASIRTLERLLALSPEAFEEVSQRLFQHMGYRVRRVGGTGDGGIDLECAAREGTVLVQCKRYHGSVGAPQVRDFYGALSKAQAARGYLVTTGSFTEAARRWTDGLPIPLELVDGPTLVGLVRAYLAPEVTPFTERTSVRLGLVVVLLVVTLVAAFVAPGADSTVLPALAPDAF